MAPLSGAATPDTGRYQGSNSRLKAGILRTVGGVVIATIDELTLCPSQTFLSLHEIEWYFSVSHSRDSILCRSTVLLGTLGQRRGRPAGAAQDRTALCRPSYRRP